MDEINESVKEIARTGYADAMMERSGAEPHKRRAFESDFDEMLEKTMADAWDECFLAVMRSIQSIAWGEDGPVSNPYRENQH